MNFAIPVLFIIFIPKGTLGAEIMTLNSEQWYVLNLVTFEMILPTIENIIPVISELGQIAIQKGTETAETILKVSDGQSD
jgi:hypothetical protein|tara:strand:- start:575 stop:814 length:240 start_codon:yes stop_codon:yes gene_type:complete